MPDTVARVVALIVDAFEKYDAQFNAISRRTRTSFEKRNWADVQDAAVERIDLYDRFINQTLFLLRGFLGERIHEPSVWSELREAFGTALIDLDDRELYKTYFNSLTRRTFGTRGVNHDIEFVDMTGHPTRGVAPTSNVREYDLSDATISERILSDYRLNAEYADLAGCTNFLAGELRAVLDRVKVDTNNLKILKAVFFRGTRGILVGRVGESDDATPVLIALAHPEAGVMVDAVITSRSQVSMLFGFTRSYFHAELDCVANTVAFLAPLMPDKAVGEIYTVLGRAKQGKTERYREIAQHLENSSDDMVVAPGSKGMVMAVFTLPSIDLVFKVIRDKFAYPKTVVRQQVLDSYSLVFKHDRAGRLVDAQEFRRMKFPRGRFSEAVLTELSTECANSVTMTDSEVIVHHLYIERRIDPLNLYLKNLTEAEAEPIIRDYGQAIRDLAMTNIFPGDLLLKNFGVTRHGRVVFYDYDELCLVTDCKFRKFPRARSQIEELSDETWFNVGPDDIFPEQFESFLGLPAPLLAIFKRYHLDVLTPEFWQSIKQHLEAGLVLDFPHYAPSRLSD